MPYPDRYYKILTDKYFEMRRNGIMPTEALKTVIDMHDVDRAVVWDTTCRGCADLLDKLYERDVQDGLI